MTWPFDKRLRDKPLIPDRSLLLLIALNGLFGLGVGAVAGAAGATPVILLCAVDGVREAAPDGPWGRTGPGRVPKCR